MMTKEEVLIREIIRVLDRSSDLVKLAVFSVLRKMSIGDEE